MFSSGPYLYIVSTLCLLAVIWSCFTRFARPIAITTITFHFMFENDKKTGLWPSERARENIRCLQCGDILGGWWSQLVRACLVQLPVTGIPWGRGEVMVCLGTQSGRDTQYITLVRRQAESQHIKKLAKLYSVLMWSYLFLNQTADKWLIFPNISVGRLATPGLFLVR